MASEQVISKGDPFAVTGTCKKLLKHCGHSILSLPDQSSGELIIISDEITP